MSVSLSVCQRVDSKSFLFFLLLAFLTSVDAVFLLWLVSCVSKGFVQRSYSIRVSGVQTGPECNAECRTTVFRTDGAGGRETAFSWGATTTTGRRGGDASGGRSCVSVGADFRYFAEQKSRAEKNRVEESEPEPPLADGGYCVCYRLALARARRARSLSSPPHLLASSFSPPLPARVRHIQNRPGSGQTERGGEGAVGVRCGARGGRWSYGQTMDRE